MADEILILTVDDHPETLDKIGERFAKIEPGTTLTVRMPLILGLMFLEDQGATVPPPGTVGTRLRKSSRLATRTPGVSGPPTNLWGDRKIASFRSRSSSGSSPDGFIAMLT